MCNSASKICSCAIFKQFILSGQEGSKSQSFNKIEISKQFHSLSTFQDRRISFNIGFSPTEEFFDKK